MREWPRAEQVGRINALVAQLGLDDVDRFRRLRAIVGHPVNALSQLTPAEADVVIDELQASLADQRASGPTGHHTCAAERAGGGNPVVSEG